MEKKLSIIIPAYNCKDTIERSILSILNQNYTNLEIIIVDDGSSDGTGIILDELEKKDNRIKVYHKNNSGVSSARNFGIEKATGYYITFVDADDYIEYDMYKQMISTDADLIISGIIYEDENSKNSIKKVLAKEIIDKNTTLVKIFKGNIAGCVWNKIFKANIIKNNNIRFNERIYYAEDLLFTCSYTNFIEKSSIIEEAYYHYIQNNNSAMHRDYSEKNATVLLAYDEIYKLYNGDDILVNYIEYSECYNICLLIYIIYFSRKNNNYNKNELIGKYKRRLKSKYRDCKNKIDINIKIKIIINLMTISPTICCRTWKLFKK